MKIVLVSDGRDFVVRPDGHWSPRYVVPPHELEETVRLWGWAGPDRDPDYPQTPEEYAATEGREPIDDPGFFGEGGAIC